MGAFPSPTALPILCVYVQVPAHIRVHACGGEKITLCVFICPFPLSAPGVLLSPHPPAPDSSCPSSHSPHMGIRLHLAPHGRMASTRPTEPSSRPSRLVFFLQLENTHLAMCFLVQICCDPRQPRLSVLFLTVCCVLSQTCPPVSGRNKCGGNR